MNHDFHAAVLHTASSLASIRQDSELRKKLKIMPNKDGFYSEGTDAFVISSNRRTLLFS
jgi:hypothetical protein